MAATHEQTTTDSQTGYADAMINRVTAENAIEYAYRDLGADDVPLVLLQHFRGNLDNWDPALIDDLAAERRVVPFDNVGVGATTGVTPNGDSDRMILPRYSCLLPGCSRTLGSRSTRTRPTASFPSTTAGSRPT